MYWIQSSINTCFVQQAVYPFQNKKTMLNSVLSPAETTLQAFRPPRNLSNLIGVRNLIYPSFLGNLYRKIQLQITVQSRLWPWHEYWFWSPEHILRGCLKLYIETAGLKQQTTTEYVWMMLKPSGNYWNYILAMLYCQQNRPHKILKACSINIDTLGPRRISRYVCQNIEL